MDNQSVGIKETEWDSSLATLMRIDNGLKYCAAYSVQEDYSNWFKHLETCKREAYPKMTEEEQEKCKQLFNKIRGTIRVIKNSHGDKKLIAYNVLDALDEAETYLREVMDRHNMLMRDSKKGFQRF